MQKNKNTKGQIAQEALMSFVIYTLFILVLLGALNHTLPQIQQKQENEMQKQINNYRCTTIDNIAALQTESVTANGSNSRCISNFDPALVGAGAPRFEKRQLD